MSESPLDEDQEIAENIQNRLFYEEATQTLLIQILRDSKAQDLGFLDSCTELVHVHLRMLERYSKQNADMVVRSKRQARKKKKQIETAKDVFMDSNDAAPDPDAEDNGTAARNIRDITEDAFIENNDAPPDSDAEDNEKAARNIRERKFDFNRFAFKYSQQACIDSFVKFTTFYKDLSHEQLKRAHRFFYRVAFKMEKSVMLFRVDIIALFMRMMQGADALHWSHPAYKEWDELTRQIIKKCTRKIEERPELIVEMLFSKINATTFFLEYGHEQKTTKKAPKPPAEMEIWPGIEESMRLGVAVAVLIDLNKGDYVDWAKKTLLNAVATREKEEESAIVQRDLDRAQKENESGILDDDSTNQLPAPRDIAIKVENEDIKRAILKEARLRLLMTMAGMKRLDLGDEAEESWIIPSELTTEALKDNLARLKQFEMDPPTFDDKSPEDLIRRKPTPKVKGVFDESDDDGIDPDDEEMLFEPGGPTPMNKSESAIEKLKKKRRTRRSKTDGEEEDPTLAEERRKVREQKKLEQLRAIKSELYVRDSDDDDDNEKDKEFFEKEEQLRVEHNKKVTRAIERMANGGGLDFEELGITGEEADNLKRVADKSKVNKKRKKVSLAISDDSDSERDSDSDSDKSMKKKTKRRATTIMDDSDSDMLNSNTELSSSEAQRSSSPVRDMGSKDLDGTDEHTDTPLSSQHDDGQAMSINRSAKIGNGNSKTISMHDAEDEDEDDEDVPIMPVRRRRVGPFAVESDSE
jgi:replication fork protection complex subunit Tof1/Swi1